MFSLSPVVKTVLLVHPDADRWASELSDQEALVTAASTAQEARAYLAGTAFDAVFLGAGADEAGRVQALRDTLGLATQIVVVDGVAEIARQLAGGDEDATRGEAGVAAVRGELARLAHALNNPLAVIAGNAQLAAEMAKAVPTDETIVEAIESIRQGAADLERLFAEIGDLRRLLTRPDDG